ncbi:adenylate/guanylate cyclase domain-containing protein [Actinotalea sp. K2]|uniref:adenylate/guanylate cyclase domain-containing protein n=1 Tax=Actinotalea sp. K2 TaxID=2939438 RepID=UPI002016BD7C|nr:adenylate/guanylate cyclase domain-containing protein [Actinotalea sp. K2]MCL3862433.1 adenylate/guanylate cyclase domain-containing protein [Actinotalea sp. K2]
MPDDLTPSDDPGLRDSTLARIEEQLLGGPRCLDLDQVAARAEVSTDEVRLFWRALGLPMPAPDAVAFTEEDATALRRVARVAREHEVGERTAVSVIRSLGHTTERLVLWQVEAIVEHLAERYDLDDTSARLLLLDRLPDLAPVLEGQLVHAWRRQLAAMAGRFAAEFGQARVTTDGGDRLPLVRAVGFADIVSFTTRTAGLGSHDLADFVQQFESQARDVVTAAGGRVVKTIGDAVLFVADDAVAGARVALGLADAFGDGRGVAPVRVGLVWGRVLSRFGDVFGPPVALAARLTDQAEPGTVLLDHATAGLLAPRPELRLTELPERETSGLGSVRRFRLEHASG